MLRQGTLSTMGMKTLLLLIIVAFASANDHDRLTELESLLENEQDDLLSQFDVDDLSEIRIPVEDAEINSDKESYNILGILSAVPGIFKNGDAERWTTLNFAYQLACYAGETGNFLTQALWAVNRFNGYGCYCGGGEYQGTYVDATDRCCKIHDECYIRVQNKYKLSLGCHVYTVPYSVSCCKNEKYTKCTDSGPSAGRELCDCDQEMAKCAAGNSGSYENKYLDNRSQCTGGDSTKPLGPWDALKTCKDSFTPYVTFPQTYGSQGKCPSSGGGGGGFWWGK